MSDSMLKPNGHGIDCLCDICWNALLAILDSGPMVDKSVKINPDGSRIIKAVATDNSSMGDGLG